MKVIVRILHLPSDAQSGLYEATGTKNVTLWDSLKPPGFHPKYLKLCSEDEQSFYGFGATWG